MEEDQVTSTHAIVLWVVIIGGSPIPNGGISAGTLNGPRSIRDCIPGRMMQLGLRDIADV